MCAEGISVNTFFSRDGCLFPEISDDNIIPTASFLKAANEVLPLFEKLGSAFTAVKYDIHGNIRTLEQKQSMNPELYVSIKAMLIDEATKKDSTLAQSALWLKRGLDFICTFFENMMSNEGEDLVESMKYAYKQVLLPYHSFMVQQTYSLMVKSVPYERDFVKMLNEGNVETDIVYDEMEVYVKRLRSNIVVLNNILKENGFELEDKTD